MSGKDTALPFRMYVCVYIYISAVGIATRYGLDGLGIES